jgi:hypothetical protein
MSIRVFYDCKRLESDMVARGWNALQLAAAATTTEAAKAAGFDGTAPLPIDRVRRALRGESHTPSTFVLLAAALGRDEAEYRMKTDRPPAPPRHDGRRRSGRRRRDAAA